MIQLYSTSTRIVTLVEEALSSLAGPSPRWGKRALPFELYAPLRRELPKVTDYVVTGGQLSGPVERFAASRGAMPVVLPEGGDWLLQKATQAQDEDNLFVLIGSDYSKVAF